MQATMLVGMRRTSLAEMPCPVARTLDVVGEWWTLLIVRDALLGARRFEDFKATGIADNILSARLRRLVDEGVLERVPYQERPERHEYVLTAKGRALGTVVQALRSWGLRWTSGEDFSPPLVHVECGHEAALGFHCPHCDRPVGAGELEVRGPAR
jgi:DNA-binding HxlR family transcriptional regulator